MNKKIIKEIKRIIVLILVIVMLFDEVKYFNTYAASSNRKITLSQAVNMGLGKSKKYKKIKSKIALKNVKYAEAVKSINLKKKNMSTFRWSPLLKFKFPEKATLAQEYEFTYKPLQIQSETDVLKHQLTDIKYEVTEEVSNLYTEIYTYQEKISYKEELLSGYNQNLKRNQARLLTGEAKQSDIDKIESSIKATENALASDKRTFESDKAKLTDLIGLNITSGYEFVNPYVESKIDRSRLEWLVSETLSRSQSYYEAKMTTKLALTSLDTNYSLMAGQYGWRMGYISDYVSKAKNGQEIDTDAFKAAYDSFLVNIDSPWTGKIKILFIRIPREWFKGSIDGVRYVEDDPYALYTNVLEYQEAVSDQESLKKDIRKEVEAGFENLVTAKNTFEYSKEQQDKTMKEMNKAAIQNKAGELSFEEYDEIRKEYEELQISTMENLELYTEQLYSYDRLTCGAITELLNETDNQLSAGSQGQSNIDEEESGIYYYINSIVEDNVFELGVYLTDDCETEITQFELWIDGTKIGDRTEIGKTIRHLTLDLDKTEKVVVRLYENENFVSDCEIDPQTYRGKLSITLPVKNENTDTKRILGDYSYTLNKKTGMVILKVIPASEINAKYFKATNSDGKFIYSDTPISVDSELTYLSILADDLDKIKIIFYDDSNKEIAKGIIDKKNKQIIEE